MAKRATSGADALAKSIEGEEEDRAGRGKFRKQVAGDARQKSGNDANGAIQKGAKKSDRDEDEDDEDNDEDGGDDNDEDGDEDDEELEKSLARLLGADADLAKSIDASPILEAMVDGIDEIMTANSDEIVKAIGKVDGIVDLLAKGMVTLLSRSREQDEIIKSLGERLDQVIGTPAVNSRKSMRPGQQTLAKSVTGATDSGMPSLAILQDKLIKSLQLGKISGSDAARLASAIDYGTLTHEQTAYINQI